MVVIDAPYGSSSAVALALEQPDESSLELFAGARVDDGVHAAIEVSQPEDDLEDNFGGLQRWEERTLVEMKRNMVRGRGRGWRCRVWSEQSGRGETCGKDVILTLGPCLAMLLQPQ